MTYKSLTKRWYLINNFKHTKSNLDQFDAMCDLMLIHLAILTEKGIKFAEGKLLDEWKELVWDKIESKGLLPA